MVITKTYDAKCQHMNVHVITRGGACTGEDATQKWIPRQPKDKTIIKKVTPLSKFDVHKQNEILMEARKEFERPQTPSASPTWQILESPRKGNQVKEFFQYYLNILEDPSVTKKMLKAMRNHMETQDEPIEAPLPERGVR